MSLLLKPETEELIISQMEHGGYSSADDLVRVALGALHQIENQKVDAEELAEIRRSLAEIERGDVVSWEEASAPLREKYGLR